MTLLERSIVAAHEAGFDEVVVVTGHEPEGVAREALRVSRRRGLRVAVVHNARYREGNGLSVLAAKDVVGDAPFALVMADHVFGLALLRRLRAESVRPGEVVVAVDRSLGQATGVDPADAMKVQLTGERVKAIGKTLPAYDAFDAGAFVCSAAVLDTVEDVAERGDTSLAGAVQELAGLGRARALPLEDDEWWFDVDTPTDHRRGSRYLFRSTGKALDGAVATRLNRAVSQRFVTPALLSVFPSISPNQVTVTAFAVALAAAAALTAHAPLIAAVLILAASVLDGSDGEIARLAHRSSRFGSFFDAVLDRAADGLLFTSAAIYLATTGDLAGPLGSAQVLIVSAVAGLALVGHLLVSYTTAKATVDLGHRYHGALVAGGRGRDLRLLMLTLGALGAAVHASSLLAALAVVAVLCAGIVSVRLRASWWAGGPGAHYMGVRAVAFDFDGTVADSMGTLAKLAAELLSRGCGMPRDEATSRYLATAGDDFRTQLDVIADGYPCLDDIAASFEAAKEGLMGGCLPFADAGAAIERLGRADVPTLICSSTRAELVGEFCRRHGLAQRAAAVDGWRPDRPKVGQLRSWAAAIGVAPNDVLFVGDALRDAAIARAAGVRFVGLSRPGHPDAFAGSGVPVVTSLTHLARLVASARRSPVTVTIPAGKVGPAAPEPLAALATAPFEVADLVGPHQPAHAVEDAYRRDGAVGDLDVPVDLGSRPKRPGDRGPHHGIVGEHHGRARGD
jgi:choline kinase/phosphoglycolate phosphatase-like HAD superfamily hydrolase/phosphatidylglycerophosphate synthase